MEKAKVMQFPTGKTVKVAGINWVILDHIEGKGTLCLRKQLC